ncbi:hypothetical protein MSPP1_003897 [Malassezia sp. CBS 17886]|nr:hypothetical protein MSPP1_003897 [Malassezia sp. CBS 17886]
MADGKHAETQDEQAALAGAPAEVADILTHLARHRQVRGCATIAASDGSVMWRGGAAFERGSAGGGMPQLDAAVALVRDVLRVTRTHIEAADPQDALSLLRLRTRRYELIVTPSGKYVLLVLSAGPDGGDAARVGDGGGGAL